MNISECYKAMGGNYEEVLGRLRSERLIAKFLKKFPADPSFAALEVKLREEDGPEAFRAVHTLKGVCQNLGLQDLLRACEPLTEALRQGKTAGTGGMFEEVKTAYQRAIEAIRNLETEMD